jgi:hypothetical protein
LPQPYAIDQVDEGAAVLVHLVDVDVEFQPQASWHAADALWLRTHRIAGPETLGAACQGTAWAEENGREVRVSLALAKHFRDLAVHVPDRPGDRLRARRLGRPLWLSTHSLDALKDVPLCGPGGWVISPYASPLSKTSLSAPLDRERLFALPAAVRARTLVLGGITPAFYDEVRAAGFLGAVTSGAGYSLSDAAF